MTDNERKSILQQQIMQYVSQGWNVISQTDTTAQLTLQAKKGCLMWFLIGPFMLLRKDKAVYISIGEQGEIQKTETKR